MSTPKFETNRGHYDDLPTLRVLDLVIVDILSQWPRVDTSMGQIAVTALRRPAVSGIELLRSTDDIHHHGFHVLSFILEWFACSWPKIWYITQNFVISTHIFVRHCSPGANKSVYREYVCI
jgi:hypothetical protein